MPNVDWLDDNLIRTTMDGARASPRKRKNRNFHLRDTDVCHRLVNALVEGSYMAPHCHASPDKDETLIALSGRIGLLVFDAGGTILVRDTLNAAGPKRGVTVPHGVIHAWVVLSPECVVFEAKGGPYRPITPAEQVAWAPLEGSPEAPAYLASLRKLWD